MQYKDVLDDLIDILKRHRMIVTWGYGNLSDLTTPFKKLDAATRDGSVDATVYNIDYPYAFLQPVSHNLSKGKSTFNFNLIMMEQCNDDPMSVIQAQSNCYQYIKDVLAEIYYNYDQKYDFTLNSNINPFKEKYNDTVSGMTAAISIEIPTILDDCIAPFAPKYDDLIMHVGYENIQTIGQDAPEDRWLQADEIFKNPTWFQWDGANQGDIVDITQDRPLKITIEGYVRQIEGTGDPETNLWLKENRPTADQWTKMIMSNWPQVGASGEPNYWFTAELELPNGFGQTTTSFQFGFYDFSAATANYEFKQIQIKIYQEQQHGS
jgi:hypothetical protein